MIKTKDDEWELLDDEWELILNIFTFWTCRSHCPATAFIFQRMQITHILWVRFVKSDLLRLAIYSVFSNSLQSILVIIILNFSIFSFVLFFCNILTSKENNFRLFTILHLPGLISNQ
jgi:hypothetical protein